MTMTVFEKLSLGDLNNSKEHDTPDLFVIDEGKDKLSALNEVLKNYEGLSCDLISLAKEEVLRENSPKKNRCFLLGRCQDSL